MARKLFDGPARGSQKWIQILVNEHRADFRSALAEPLKLGDGEGIEWLSPRDDDEFAEYSDSDFIDRLGLQLAATPLAEFWPVGGAVWDALGQTESGQPLLVEAKAHIGEMVSTPSGAISEESIGLIARSLRETKSFVHGKEEIDWSRCFYQYCNRLAHLYLLRHRNGIPAHLVFVYFVGDADMSGPKTQVEWQAAVELLERFLGVTRHRLRPYIHHVHFDVMRLSSN